MEILPILPHFQAALNALTLVLILIAYGFIRNGNKTAHKKAMISALVVSAVFLVSYLYYHAHIGHVPFAGEGGIRVVYFTILFAHIIMAAFALVLILMAAWRALVLADFDSHKRVAKKAYPIWVFVCVTGIVVYVMAFHIYAVAVA